MVPPIQQSLLSTSPSDAVHFYVSDESLHPAVGGRGNAGSDDIDWNRTTLRIRSTSAAPIAFKVRTTKASMYFVRPNQGIISPGGTVCVRLTIQAPAAGGMKALFHRCDLQQDESTESAETTGKFMIQSRVVGTDFAARMSGLPAAEQGPELQQLWADTAATQMSFKRLRCRFSRTMPPRLSGANLENETFAMSAEITPRESLFGDVSDATALPPEPQSARLCRSGRAGHSGLGLAAAGSSANARASHAHQRRSSLMGDVHETNSPHSPRLRSARMSGEDEHEVLALSPRLTEPASPAVFQRAEQCAVCQTQFSLFTRRHHCRHCGQSVCAEHSRVVVARSIQPEEVDLGDSLSSIAKILGVSSHPAQGVRMCSGCISARRREARSRLGPRRSSAVAGPLTPPPPGLSLGRVLPAEPQSARLPARKLAIEAGGLGRRSRAVVQRISGPRRVGVVSRQVNNAVGTSSGTGYRAGTASQKTVGSERAAQAAEARWYRRFAVCFIYFEALLLHVLGGLVCALVPAAVASWQYGWGTFIGDTRSSITGLGGVLVLSGLVQLICADTSLLRRKRFLLIFTIADVAYVVVALQSIVPLQPAAKLASVFFHLLSPGMCTRMYLLWTAPPQDHHKQAK